MLSAEGKKVIESRLEEVTSHIELLEGFISSGEENLAELRSSLESEEIVREALLQDLKS